MAHPYVDRMIDDPAPMSFAAPVPWRCPSQSPPPLMASPSPPDSPASDRDRGIRSPRTPIRAPRRDTLGPLSPPPPPPSPAAHPPEPCSALCGEDSNDSSSLTPPTPSGFTIGGVPYRPSRKPPPTNRFRRSLPLLSLRLLHPQWERRPPPPGHTRPVFVNTATGGVFGYHATRQKRRREDAELDAVLRLSCGEDPTAADAAAAGDSSCDPSAAPNAPSASPAHDERHDDPEGSNPTCAFCRVDTQSPAAIHEFCLLLQSRRSSASGSEGPPEAADVLRAAGLLRGPFHVPKQSRGSRRSVHNDAAAPSFWAHDQCLLWCPEVYELAEGREFVNVAPAYRRARRGMPCGACGRPGATLGCRVKACRRNYHGLCALLVGDGLDTEAFAVSCQQHAPRY